MNNLSGRSKKGIRGFISFVSAALLITSTFFGATAAFRLLDKKMHPLEYTRYVDYYSGLYNVPKEVVYAVILVESRFDSAAVSRAGACGLMQLMPQTYKKIAEELQRIPDEEAVFDPGMNICCGVYLLSELFKKYQCWDTVYAAYNAGESAVDRWLSDTRYSDQGRLSDIPYKETRSYVKKVKCATESYSKIYGF